MWMHGFISLGYVDLRVELLGHTVTLSLTLWKDDRLFFKMTAPFHMSTDSKEVPIFPYPCLHNYYLSSPPLPPPPHYCHSSGCEVISHCGLNLHFLDS